jgi:hypothetical protein
MNTSVNFVMSARDPNGLPVSFNVVSGTSNGTYSVNNTIITYTPNQDFVGQDSLQYTASNGTYTSVPAEIQITVNSIGE